MSTINKIISLLDSKEKTQKELTDYLGIEKSVFTTWKNGKSQSYNKYLSKIAEFFNVSTDYLLRETIKLDFIPHEEENYIFKCPICEHECTNLLRILDVDFGNSKSYGIAIEFWCESDHKFYLIIESYKGVSYIVKVDEHGLSQPFNDIEFDNIPISLDVLSERINKETHIKKYRALDKHGKEIVDFILENEYERCQTIKNLPKATDNVKTIKLPMAELKASAGTGQWLGEEEYEDWVDVVDTPESRRANVVIEVSGNSMEPQYHSGDKVLVKLQPSIEQGEIGIFIVDGCGYIKKLGYNELISVNEDYDNIPLNEYNNVTCVGKAIGIAEIV